MALALIGLALVVNAAHGHLPFSGPGGSTAPHVGQGTSTLNCPAPVISMAASQALVHAQLTTGLQNPQQKDYRPVDSVTRFAVGQAAYLTFQIATSQAGTASVVFCTPTERVASVLATPVGSAGRDAEFAARFVNRDVGVCRATLLWNGAAAATLVFTIAAT